MSKEYELFLQHHGVKGMKWGVRRFQNPDGSLTAAGQKRQNKLNEKAAAKRQRKINRDWTKAYNAAADECNSRLIPELNKKYAKYDFTDRATNAKIKKVYDKYVEEYADSWNKLYQTKIDDLFGKNPTGKQDTAPFGFFDRYDIEDMKNE